MLISSKATAIDTIWIAKRPALLETSWKTNASVYMKREDMISTMSMMESR